MTVTVRPAVEADVEAIRVVGLVTWPATYEAVAGRDYVTQGLERWWSADAVRDSILRGGVFVGELDGAAVVDSLPAGSTRLGLDYVDGNERAAAFYRARGFRVTGRTPSPLGVGPDEILMELPLAGRRPQRTP